MAGPSSRTSVTASRSTRHTGRPYGAVAAMLVCFLATAPVAIKVNQRVGPTTSPADGGHRSASVPIHRAPEALINKPLSSWLTGLERGLMMTPSGESFFSGEERDHAGPSTL